MTENQLKRIKWAVKEINEGLDRYRSGSDRYPVNSLVQKLDAILDRVAEAEKAAIDPRAQSTDDN